MQLHLHLKKDYLALRFINTTDRDIFFAELGKNPVNGYYLQSACERVGNRTIQIHLSKVEFSHQWPVQFLSKHIKEIIREMVPVKVVAPEIKIQEASVTAATIAAEPKPVFPEVSSPLEPVKQAAMPRAEAIEEAIPQSVTPVDVPKLDGRTRAGRAARASQKVAA